MSAAVSSPGAAGSPVSKGPLGPDGSIEPFVARVVASYTSPNADGLSLKRGQCINVLRASTTDKYLYFGEYKGRCGWFPNFYVRRDGSLKVQINAPREEGLATTAKKRLGRGVSVVLSPSRSPQPASPAPAPAVPVPLNGGAAATAAAVASPASPLSPSSSKRQRFSIRLQHGISALRDACRPAPSDADKENVGQLPAPASPAPQAVRAVGYGSALVLGGRPGDLLVLQRAGLPHLSVPAFVRQIARFLYMHALGSEGLFRVPGPSDLLNQLCVDLDGGSWADMHLQADADPYALCDLLKRYVKSLPVPLVTGAPAAVMLHAATDASLAPAERLAALVQGVAALPAAEAAVLRDVCQLLHQVLLNAHANRMDAPALVLLWATHLIRGTGNTPDLANGQLPSPRTLQRLKDPSEKKTLALLLISKAPQIFGLPDFSPDGAPLSNDVRLRPRARLCGHKASILSLCLTADGTEVWSGGSHGALLAFNARKTRFSRVLPTAPGAVTQMCAAGPYVWLAVPERSRVEVRSAASGACALTLELPVGARGALCHEADVVCVALGSALASYGASLLTELRTRVTLPAAITGLVSVGEGRVWAACADRQLYEVRDGTLRELGGLERAAALLQVLPGDAVAAASSSDGLVHVLDVRSGQRLRSLAHDNRVCAMTVVGTELWVTTWDHRMYVWDWQTGLLLAGAATDHTQFVSDLLLLYNRKLRTHQLWSASGDRSLLISDVAATLAEQ